MEIEITATASMVVNFAPATTMEEILQNVQTILATPVYSVPLDRAIGVNAELLDLPMPVSQARLAAEIVQALQKFEPRVEVTKVFFTCDALSGRLQPTVRLRLKE
ncbi:GPW/gp25 family protein [Sporomusa sp.]|uniref:GPW/gp25 family protein n=1 Tax=Sporomusa sp. TaxID=2078658 RepID=UPI002B6BE150|nr:GPW/gp25 family protein [Sporomusa sp.]HWR07744.1 GPW/gp25 family protein [Sporomusa sp.]